MQADAEDPVVYSLSASLRVRATDLQGAVNWRILEGHLSSILFGDIMVHNIE